MKTFFRWAVRLLALFALLLFAGVLLLNPLARKFAEHQLRKQTGLAATIGSVNIGLFTPHLTISNLVIINSVEFGGSPFVEIPELYVEYDPTALRSGNLHCKLLRFNLSRINLVEDKNGRRNFDMLQKTARPPVSAQIPQNASPVKSSGGIQFTGIDTLNLTLGKATYARLNQPGHIEELDMNVNHQIFNKVRTAQDLDSVLLVALLRSGANLMQSSNSQTWLQLLAPQKK